MTSYERSVRLITAEKRKLYKEQALESATEIRRISIKGAEARHLVPGRELEPRS
jgi:hypothetical protein